MSMLTAGRSCWVLAVESLAIAASTLFSVLIAMRVAAVTPVPNDFFFFGVTLLCGVILADAVSGFVHWFCDTFFEEKDSVDRAAPDCVISRTPSRSAGNDSSRISRTERHKLHCASPASCSLMVVWTG